MDIVKSTIERMGGHIQIDSVVGAGTCFSITLPRLIVPIHTLLGTIELQLAAKEQP